MNRSSRFGVGSLLAGLVALSAFAASAQPTLGASTTVKFSPKGGMHEMVAQILPHATSAIHISMYSVSPGQVAMWEPLKAAIARGVKCYVILNEANKASNAAKAAAFAGIGCDVRAISYTMHNKFAVIDGVTTCTGSSNWSRGAEEKYSENRICFVNNRAIATDYLAEFKRLYDRSVDYRVKRGYPATPAGAGTMPYATKGIANLFTSQNAPNTALLSQALITAINGATTTLDVAVANYNTAAVKDAVCAAKARNVRVRVLTDQGQFSISTSMVKALESCGVEVRYIAYGLTWYHAYSQLMHHKYLIADKKHLLTGSYNWSDTAEKSNAENLQWITKTGRTNSPLLTAFQKEFDSLWELNRAKVPALIASFSNPSGGCQPIHWDTSYLALRISLTRAEYTKVRGLAFRAGLHDRRMAAMRCVDVNTRQFYPTVPQGAKFGSGL
jgi:phosphatidylserine/phosphatidylglycerophosphate/cardiolipin synthase-like enzyme